MESTPISKLPGATRTKAIPIEFWLPAGGAATTTPAINTAAATNQLSAFTRHLLSAFVREQPSALDGDQLSAFDDNLLSAFVREQPSALDDNLLSAFVRHQLSAFVRVLTAKVTQASACKPTGFSRSAGR